MVIPHLPLIYYPDTLLPFNLTIMLLSAIAKYCGVKVVTSKVLVIFMFVFILMICYMFHIVMNYIGF